MKDIKVSDILKITKGELIIGNENILCENFTRDTRDLIKGGTYIGLKGTSFDGSEFWEEAFKKGANCVIIQNMKITEEEKNIYKDKAIIEVKDTLKALQEIAMYKRSLYNIPVVAITGSVGKTSTKDIVANVIAQKYKTLKTLGNLNNHIGLPLTILRLKDEEALVVEMGMNHFGEISCLTTIAKPNICIITNIGTSHIGNLGSRENILKAKLEILEGNENPTIIINNDNDLLHNWYEKNKKNYKIKTFGIENESDYNAADIRITTQGSEFYSNLDGKKEKIQVPVGGEHFVLNALCAITVGKELGIDTKDIIQGIGKFELTSKRMELKKLENGITIINDAYNASFESMKAALKYFSEFKNNRKIAVLGDMLELGDYAKELHEKVGKEVAKNKIDILMCCGENAKYIVNEAEKNGIRKEQIYYFENKEELLKTLKPKLEKDDIVLLKASNGMRFYEIANELEKCE